MTAYSPAADRVSGAVRQRYAVTQPGLGSQAEARVLRQSLRELFAQQLDPTEAMPR